MKWPKHVTLMRVQGRLIITAYYDRQKVKGMRIYQLVPLKKCKNRKG